MKLLYSTVLAALTMMVVAPGCGDSGGSSPSNPPSGPPSATDDVVETPADTPITIDVMANDSDPYGESIVIESWDPPTSGTVDRGSDETLIYVPEPGFTGFVSFTYTIADEAGSTATAQVTVIVGVTIQLQLTEIKGLFKPDATGVGVYQAAYLSDDDAGRIYCNHAYDPGDASVTNWSENEQYVDITINVEPAAYTWPAGTRIVWEYDDVDDPSDEDPLTDPTAGRTLDPNDYDAADNDGDGTADNDDGEDNTGSLDGAAVWEEADPACALSNGNETDISGGVSKVRFNATDDGGDNFRVKAAIRLGDTGVLYKEQATGVVTVWKRIDVEYVEMASATPLTGMTDGTANTSFAKAFVELVSQQRAVLDVVVDAKLQMGLNWTSAGDACEDYVTSAGEFAREGTDGWFFSAAANYFVDAGSAAPPELYLGFATVVSDGVTLSIPPWELADDDRIDSGVKTANLAPTPEGFNVMTTNINIAQADLFSDGTILYDYDPVLDEYAASGAIVSHTTGAGSEITYDGPASTVPGTDVIIYKLNVSAVVLRNPGNPLQAIVFMYDNFSWNPAVRSFRVATKGYSTPTQYNAMTFDIIDHGFWSGSSVEVLVWGTGALVVGGISPGPNGGLEGRTIIFTASGGDLSTLIHEFGHAYGFHHICGNWDYRNDGSGQACAMHYASLNWMLDDSNPRRLDPWTFGEEGPYYCEEHIIEIRKQNLEDLAVLGWGP